MYIYSGPGSMLLLNLITYWTAFFLIACVAKRQGFRLSMLIPLFGLWPGVFFEIGFLWKDVLFATAIFLAWAIAIYFNFLKIRAGYWPLFFIFVLSVVAFGVKSNGILVVPVLFYFYFSTSEKIPLLRNLLYSGALTLAVIAAPKVVMLGSHIEKQQNFMVQYTQVYDLLGVSVQVDKNLFPDYIKDIYGEDLDPYKKLYWPGGNNHLFFGLADYGGPVATKNPVKAKELTDSWVQAISDYPLQYLDHRYENMASMLRIGAYTPAWIGDVGILDNEHGLHFEGNSVSRFLENSKSDYGWVYLPWIYIFLFIFCILFSVFRKNIKIIFPISFSVFLFAAPHFFILPAADYRYLFYCYVMAVAMIPIMFLKNDK